MSFGWRGLGKEDVDKTQRRDRTRAMILIAHVRGQSARVPQIAGWRKTKDAADIENEIRQSWIAYHPAAHNDPLPDLPPAGVRSWNQRLAQDGLDMLAHMAVTPPHGGESTITNITSDFTVREILANRIQYTSLAPNQQLRGALNLVDPRNATRPNAFPTYFLPWKAKHIVKLELTPGPPTSDFFFTSSIGGCSVFARGPANQPITYHAGIDGELPKIADEVPVALRPVARQGNSALFWHNLLEAREGVNIQTAGIGEVSRDDYVFDGMKWNGIKATKRVISFINRIEELYEDDGMKVKDIIPFGCVFGLKALNNWSFFLQENLNIQYQQTKLKPVRKWFATFPLELHQIFPRPAHRVSLIPKFCYMPWLFIPSERVFQD